VRSAQLDRQRIIGAHAHRKIRKTVAAGDLRKHGEVRRCVTLAWRNTHQADDWELKFRSASRDKRVRLIRQDTALLRLAACVDLNIQRGTTARFLRFTRNGQGEAFTVDRLDNVEKLKSLRSLVALKPTNHPQFKIWRPLAQRWPFLGGLLHPVFAEGAAAFNQKRIDPVRALRLGSNNDLNAGGIAARRMRITVDFATQFSISGDRIINLHNKRAFTLEEHGAPDPAQLKGGVDQDKD